MVSVFPGAQDNISTTIPANNRKQLTVHPDLHNLMAAAINSLEATVLNLPTLNANWTAGVDKTGVVACGGVLNAVFLVAASLGQSVFLEGGTYKIEVELDVPDGVCVYGNHWGAILRMADGANLIAIFYSSTTRERVDIHDLTIDGNTANNASGDGIRMHIKWTHIWRNRFINIPDHAIYAGVAAIDGNSALLNVIAFNEIQDSDTGIRNDYVLGDSWVMFNNIGSASYNIRSEGGPNRFIGNHCDGAGALASPLHNFYAPGAGANMMLWLNLFEGARHEAIYIQELVLTPAHSADINISNNLIKNASKDADNTWSFLYLAGGDATHPLKNIIVANNTFITDDVGFNPKYVVEGVNVDGLTIQNNSCQAMGTGYWNVTGAGSANVKIQGNLPEDFTIKSLVAGDSPYTVLLTDGVILADAVGGAITVGLPAAAAVKGRTLVVKRLNGGGNAVTLDGSGAETIDGAATLALAAQYAAARVLSGGATWWTV